MPFTLWPRSLKASSEIHWFSEALSPPPPKHTRTRTLTHARAQKDMRRMEGTLPAAAKSSGASGLFGTSVAVNSNLRLQPTTSQRISGSPGHWTQIRRPERGGGRRQPDTHSRSILLADTLRLNVLTKSCQGFVLPYKRDLNKKTKQVHLQFSNLTRVTSSGVFLVTRALNPATTMTARLMEPSGTHRT